MEPHEGQKADFKDERKSRFKIEKLEERIAPTHTVRILPEAAGNGSIGIDNANNQALFAKKPIIIML
jgi:hypothetical protein